MAKMWEGRFKKCVDGVVNDFNSSVSFDMRMYKWDITGSIAHAKMLAKVGIISEEERDVIVNELKNILSDIESGELVIDMNAEDIHMFVEEVLTKRVGSVGKKLHTARSRNDQVALDIRLYLKEEIDNIVSLVRECTEVVTDIAEENLESVMPGYTHLQRAQPVTFAHYIMAYAHMFSRDISRLRDTKERMNFSPLGAGALATTTYDIDREFTAKELGFYGVTKNSIDSVSDRDFVLELASDIALLMMHLSRMSEEIILFSSWEFKYIELDDAYATGSSIMPQKKNPDIAELVRGKAGRVIGDMTGLFAMMKGLPLAYNKDMQEDKEAIFDAIDNVKMCLKTFIPMLKTMTVIKENMLSAAKKGFINATDVAEYLVKKGMPFRDAYKATGNLVKYCIDKGVVLEELTLGEFKSVTDSFEDDVYEAIDLMTCLKGRKVIGGPNPDTVKTDIEEVRKELERYE